MTTPLRLIGLELSPSDPVRVDRPEPAGDPLPREVLCKTGCAGYLP